MKKIIIFVIALFFSLYCFAQTESSSSQELQNKFKAIADKICWDIMLKQNRIAKEQGKELSENQLKAMAESASSGLMEKYKNAFIVSDIEAKKILSNEYDDSKNKEEFNNCVKEFANLSVILPLPIQYLIEQSHSQNLTRLELEFAARLFKEYLEQNKYPNGKD
jgi:hypothetical protein